jgi:DNA polymerase-4
MLELTQDISHKLRVNNLLAGGVAISVKDETLYTKVYQCHFDYATHNSMDIAKGAFSLFEHNFNWSRTVRAVCVRAINLVSDRIPQQISLFNDTVAIEKRDKIETAIENIRERYGKTSITYACLMGDLKMPKTKDVELIMPTGMVK